MVMNAEQKIADRERRRKFFTALDLVTVASFGAAVYLFYQGKYQQGLATISIGVIIVAYFIIRRMLRNKKN